MTLAAVRDWLKTYDLFENYYIGRLDNKKEKSLGVYNRTSYGPPVMAFGNASSYDVKAVTLLIHWNVNARETEAAARALYDELLGLDNLTIAGTHVNYLMLQVPEPVSVGADDDGVYEYVIDFDIYFTRR